MARETWNRNAVCSFVVRARKAGYKVHDLQVGFCIETDGLQIFRAVDQRNEHYEVQYNEEVFADV